MRSSNITRLWFPSSCSKRDLWKGCSSGAPCKHDFVPASGVSFWPCNWSYYNVPVERLDQSVAHLLCFPFWFLPWTISCYCNGNSHPLCCKPILWNNLFSVYLDYMTLRTYKIYIAYNTHIYIYIINCLILTYFNKLSKTVYNLNIENNLSEMTKVLIKLLTQWALEFLTCLVIILIAGLSCVMAHYYY